MKPITLEWIRIAEGDWATAKREDAVTIDPNYRAVSFHSQQCGEKYLKAYLQEKSVNPERTHDLSILLTRILAYEPSWTKLQQACLELTEFGWIIVIPEQPRQFRMPQSRSNVQN